MPYQTHYLKRNISDINPELDMRIKVLGFVVDKKDDTLVIDDGSGKIQAFIDTPAMMEKTDINQLVRVFGSVLPIENGFEVKGDIVQDLSSLDINLYKKIDELYNKEGL